MQKLKKLVFPIIIAAFLGLILVQCSVGNLLPALIGKKIWLKSDKNLLAQELRRHIPVGSSIADAKTTLQLNDFQCTYRKGSDSVDSKPNWTSKEADYLFCYLETPNLVICTQTYKPFIYYKNDAVTKVDAAIGGWCL